MAPLLVIEAQIGEIERQHDSSIGCCHVQDSFVSHITLCMPILAKCSHIMSQVAQSLYDWTGKMFVGK